MKLRIENENGYSIELSSNTFKNVILLQSVDWGSITESVISDSIYGIDGEAYSSSSYGSRDITIQFMNVSYSTHLIKGAISPKTAVKLIVNEMYYINGKVIGMASPKRPARGVDFVYSITVRCFDPYFYKVDGEQIYEVDNKTSATYENGVYKYQKIQLQNDGDVPCPLYANLQIYNGYHQTKGLFTEYLWNNGSPIKKGFAFSSSAAEGTDYYITTDKNDKKILDVLPVLLSYDFAHIDIGTRCLYAYNVKGTIRINPRYYDISELI